MRIDVITNPDDWAGLAGEWNQLLNQSAANLPFLRYEFQRAWWQHKGGGEWPDAQLFILIGRTEEGTLAGIAPFFKASPSSAPTLMLIGSHEIADFLDIIVRPADHSAFLTALIEHLATLDAEIWQHLDLYNLLDESPTPGKLNRLAEANGYGYEQTILQPSPFIKIPESFDAYTAALESKHAHELRRKMRRAVRQAVPVELEIVDQIEGLEDAMEDFFRLMGLEADKAGFLSEPMRAQMEAITRAAFEHGWGQFAFLKVGHARAAAYLNFDFENRLWAYNAGFDPAFGQLSPGWLLMAKMIDWSIVEGRQVFDFMRGDEDYKYRFGGVDRHVLRAIVSRT